MFLDFCDSSNICLFASRRGGDGVSRKSPLPIVLRWICIFSDDAGFLFSRFH